MTFVGFQQIYNLAAICIGNVCNFVAVIKLNYRPPAFGARMQIANPNSIRSRRNAEVKDSVRKEKTKCVWRFVKIRKSRAANEADVWVVNHGLNHGTNFPADARFADAFRREQRRVSAYIDPRTSRDLISETCDFLDTTAITRVYCKLDVTFARWRNLNGMECRILGDLSCDTVRERVAIQKAIDLKL